MEIPKLKDNPSIDVVVETEPLSVPVLPIPTKPREEEIMPEVEPLDSDLVEIKKYIPNIIIDLKYATTDNFTGVIIYDNTNQLKCYHI